MLGILLGELFLKCSLLRSVLSTVYACLQFTHFSLQRLKRSVHGRQRCLFFLCEVMLELRLIGVGLRWTWSWSAVGLLRSGLLRRADLLLLLLLLRSAVT